MKRIFSSKIDGLLAKFCIFLIMAALIVGMEGCDGNGYTPTSKDLEIWDWYDLDDIRDNLYGDHTLMNDLDSTTAGYAKLASEAANGGRGWQPIGSSEYDFFNGNFDGQGYEIRDLFINRPGEDYVGLFGYAYSGDIQDIGVVNATVIGAKWVGGLVGFIRGTVINSYSTGSVSGAEYDTYVGGLVGRNYVTVSNCHSSCTVTGDHVGGLVADNYGTISNSYSTGSVTGNERVGGLVGNNGDTVSNSYSTGSVTGNERVGGLVGANDGTVSKSYSTGNVSGTTGVGGLVGVNYYGSGGTVSNSYYNYDEVLINDENIITTGALFNEDFEQWLSNDKFLDFNNRLPEEDGYYVVNNVTDFKQLLAFGEKATLKFRLKADLDLGDEPNFFIPCLAGEFDGNGHKISNLSFNFGFVYNVGLFGYLAPGGNVTDLASENVSITGDKNVGGLVGYSEGTVGNSSSTGSVTGQGFVGGLVGANSGDGTVSNSHFTGTVTGDCNVGGLVGANSGDGAVSNSYSDGNVTGNTSVGGLAGSNSGTLSNSYSNASVTSDNSVGGLVGANSGDGTVSNSYSSGSVTGNSVVGGLMGANYGYVANSYSTGSVSGTIGVGGLVGSGWGTVSNSFWDTETSGQATSSGGIGKTTVQMKSIGTFSGAAWNIIAVGGPGERNTTYTWNIVDSTTYPFLSWQP